MAIFSKKDGLGAELLLPAKSAFCFCCLFYFSLQYHHFYLFFYLILFCSKKCQLPFFPSFFSVFIPLSTPSKILPKVIMTLNFARNRQVLGGEGVVSIIFSCWEILLGRVPNSSKLSMWTLQILPRPSTASTGTTSRRYFERMESPHLVEIIKSFYENFTGCFCDGDISALVSGRGVSCPHCFSVLLWIGSCREPLRISLGASDGHPPTWKTWITLMM